MFKAFALAGLAVTAALSAAGGVQNVVLAQDTVSRNITVSYTLTAEAVVTIDIFTNGAPVEARLLSTMAGDVNRKVSAGERKAFWRPDHSFTGYKFDANVTARVTAWPIDNPPDFMVVDLLYPSNITYYASADALPYDLTNALYKTDRLVMRKIPAKGVRWRMGAGKIVANNNSNWRSMKQFIMSHSLMTITWQYSRRRTRSMCVLGGVRLQTSMMPPPTILPRRKPTTQLFAEKFRTASTGR